MRTRRRGLVVLIGTSEYDADARVCHAPLVGEVGYG